jgi:hypothetical protein
MRIFRLGAGLPLVPVAYIILGAGLILIKLSVLVINFANWISGPNIDWWEGRLSGRPMIDDFSLMNKPDR